MLFTQRIARSPRGPSVRTYNFRSCDRQLPWPWSIAGGGNGTRRNAAGLIETIAAANSPRFDYDPVTLASRGLLIEQGSTNFLKQSENLTLTWGKTRSTTAISGNAAPDGTATGNKLIEDATAGATHYCFQDVSPADAGETWTFTIYAKAAERSAVDLQFNSTGGAFAVTVGAYFDLAAGVAYNVSGVTTSIRPAANGWVRCAITATTNQAGWVRCLVALASGSTITYTGDGVSGAYLWGGQAERASTSYVPTTAAAVTRALEQVTCTDLSLLGHRATGFAFSVGWEHNAPGAGTTPTVLAFRDAAAQNRVQLLLNNANQLSIRVDSGGATLDQRVIAAAAANTKHRAVVAVTPAGIQVSVDGGAAVAYNVAVPLAAFTLAELGGLAGADASALNGWLRDYKDWPRVLSTNELVAEAAAV